MLSRVAIELAAGGRYQAVCRTGGCGWTGGLHPFRREARADQDGHRAAHGDMPRRLVLVTCPGCERLVELDVRSGTCEDPHVIPPHDGCPDAATGIVTDLGDLTDQAAEDEARIHRQWHRSQRDVQR